MVNTNRLISCLCVTEDRHAFMPWLLWSFDRQNWQRRELIVVDSSTHPYPFAQRHDLRVIPAQKGSSIAAKRNLALQAATGDYIAWFDDDDWQHPQRLEWLAAALADGAALAGGTRAWFVDLSQLRCTAYQRHGPQIIFNGAGFRRDAALIERFPEQMRRASDTAWLKALQRRHQNQSVSLGKQALFFWLCHGRNISNPIRKRRFEEPLATLRQQIGAAAWGDTDWALADLQVRLGYVAEERGSISSLAHRDHTGRGRRVSPQAQAVTTQTTPLQTEGAAGRSDVERRGDKESMQSRSTPSVSVMIKATVLDAAYLDVLVRHMIAQARFPFAERTMVIERRTRFFGKYEERPVADQASLDRVLERLLNDDIIDRVVDVDDSDAVREPIMARYFGPDASRIPTHASSGGPIYATLFGMEAMPTNHLLQMDADVFFYTDGVSWVEQSLAHMADDPTLWLMMAHPGPPAGAPGASLGPSNRRRATWDRARGIWRFPTATTRYFLCDRRKLYGTLRLLPRSGGCAPLEQCISAAMRRHGSARGALGDLRTWHLHGWHHGTPFPEWSAAIAQAVAAGRFPREQCGQYDLRLDQWRDRHTWKQLLNTVADQTEGALSSSTTTISGEAAPTDDKGPQSVEVGEVQTRSPAPTSVTVECQPMAVVIPVRNRAGQRVRNALTSLRWQQNGPPVQMLIVSHGSRPEVDAELADICQDLGADLIRVGQPEEAWNKPLALNTGIRAATADARFIMTMDVDMILAPDFLTAALAALRRHDPALVLCRSADLPRNAAIPASSQTLLKAFQPLRETAKLRRQVGCGGIQAVKRDFFFEIRGYDEDLIWWGSMDKDILIRAKLAGLREVWIEEKTAMLHQWHPRKHAVLEDPAHVAQARRSWQANHKLIEARARQLERNPHGWGGVGSRP